MRARKMRAIEMCAREMREGDACESEANASAQPVLSLALFADNRAKETRADPSLQPSLVPISSLSSFTPLGPCLVPISRAHARFARRHYLVLSFDRGFHAPKGLSDGAAKGKGGVRVDNLGRERKGKVVRKQKGGGKTKEWIERKKEVQRKKGHDVKDDTRFTGRKRKDKF